MVNVSPLILLALLISGSLAIDIGQILGFGRTEAGAKAAADENSKETSEQRNILGNIGDALVPIAGQITSAASQIQPTVYKSVFIQVTRTHTTFPVCVTAYTDTPPCGALSPPSESLYYEGHPHEHGHTHHGAHDAYHLGNNQAVFGYEIYNNPQLGLVGEVPKPVNHDYEYKNIQPTAAVRMQEATAMIDIPREKRADVELEASENDAEMESSTSVRPHPRYLKLKKLPKFPLLLPLAAAVPLAPLPPVTETRTLYVTKVEQLYDTQVTATVVANNCIPDHIPFCPAVHQPVYPSEEPYPVHQPSHPVEHNGPNNGPHYGPHNGPHTGPLRPGQWHKDASEKSDTKDTISTTEK